MKKIEKIKKFIGVHQELVLGVGTLAAIFLGGIYLGRNIEVAKLSNLVDRLGKDEFRNIVKTSPFSNKTKSFVLINRDMGNFLLDNGIFLGRS